MKSVVKIEKGLEGVYFTESKICKVDGTLGRLCYRGYSIEDLAENVDAFELCSACSIIILSSILESFLLGRTPFNM